MERRKQAGTDRRQITKLEDAELAPVDRDLLHTILFQNSQVYRSVLKEIHQKLNLLPPGAAMAGIYTMVGILVVFGKLWPIVRRAM